MTTRNFTNLVAVLTISVIALVTLAQTAHGTLAIHYSFDDANPTTATNSVGANGSYAGGSSTGTYGPGIVGANAVDPSNYINTNIDLGSTNQYSMSFWYNTSTNQQCCSNGGLYYTNGAWTNDSLHSSLGNNSSRIWHELNSGNQRNSGFVTTALNTWNHVVASFDGTSGTGLIAYTVNGVQDPVGTQTMSGPLARLAQGQVGAWNGGRVYAGQFDDWAIWTGDSLNPAESAGIYNLAISALDYNAQNADDLFGVFDTGTSAVVGGTTWNKVDDGTLTGNPGDVVDLGGGSFGLILNANGGGVSNLAAIPEPAALSLAALGLVGFGLLRRPRRNR